MDAEGLKSITEVLQNLTVDQQLSGYRILCRKLLVIYEPPNPSLLSPAQPHKIALPQLTDRRSDVCGRDAVLVLSVSRLRRSSRQCNQIAQNTARESSYLRDFVFLHE